MSKPKKPLVFRTAFNAYMAKQARGEGGAGRVYSVLDPTGVRFAVKALAPAPA